MYFGIILNFYKLSCLEFNCLDPQIEAFLVDLCIGASKSKGKNNRGNKAVKLLLRLCFFLPSQNYISNHRLRQKDSSF